MFDNTLDQHVMKVNLKGSPVTLPELKVFEKKLRSLYFNNLNFIIAICVLGSAVTYRALSLDYDSEFELLHISLYIGIWFGLFTGIMIDGGGKRRLQMIAVGIIVSTSANLFASMLVILMIGTTTPWITSVNILGSALGSMWVMTSYDEIIKGLDSIQVVNKRQYLYIQKASSHFEELRRYSEQITMADRQPVTAEYWAVREWIQDKIHSKNRQ